MGSGGREMKVVHLANNLSWGSGKAARRLHDGLLAMGVSSSMVVQEADGDAVPGVLGVAPLGGLLPRAKRAVQARLVQRTARAYTRPAGGDLFIDDRTFPIQSDDPRVQAADIVNLHWVGRSGHSVRFFEHLADKPVVWTLHDMLPFTGGCVYSGDCTRYRASCGACPQLGSSRKEDLSRAIWQRKHRAYRSRAQRGPGFCVVTPSRWLGRCARESALFREHRVEVIPYGLPTDVFGPRDRAHSRALLGIPSDAFVIVAGSIDARTTRKGFAQLRQALQILPEAGARRPLVLATFGTSWPSDAASRGVTHVSLGRIGDERFMSCAYSAADVTVVPSLEDNLPLVVLESLACGTPVVGFDTGGIPDFVDTERQGIVVPRGDVAALAAAIERLWSAPAHAAALGQAARVRAVEQLGQERQAAAYHALYRSLLDGR